MTTTAKDWPDQPGFPVSDQDFLNKINDDDEVIEITYNMCNQESNHTVTTTTKASTSATITSTTSLAPTAISSTTETTTNMTMMIKEESIQPNADDTPNHTDISTSTIKDEEEILSPPGMFDIDNEFTTSTEPVQFHTSMTYNFWWLEINNL